MAIKRGDVGGLGTGSLNTIDEIVAQVAAEVRRRSLEAEESAKKSLESEQKAEESADRAEDFATLAENSAILAKQSEDVARDYRLQALDSAEEAATKADEAALSATVSENSAIQSANAAALSLQYRNEAELEADRAEAEADRAEEAAAGVSIPAGVILPYGGSEDPAGWLRCDGRAVSRSEYSRLFAVIGTTFGAGDGSTTFNLPNSANRTLVGSGSRSVGTEFGNATAKPTISVSVSAHTLSISQMPSHNHTQRSAWHAPSGSGTGARTIDEAPNVNAGQTLNQGGGGSHAHGASASSSTIDLHQPSLVVNYIIKT